ncbi:MAG TPA: hypothetical protein DCM45_03135 [Clostridiales bacterium]|nr:hypothetical protein [Clostridiales bacterium]
MMKPIRDTLRRLMVIEAAAPEERIWLEFISFIIAGFLAYLLFWLIFGTWILQIILAASTAMLLLSLYSFRKDRRNLSISIVIVTLLTCCLLVDGVLGWDFNAHYYILCTFPLLATKGMLSPHNRVFLYLSAAAAYIFGKKLMPEDVGLQNLAPWIGDILPTVNLVVAILIIGLSMLKFSEIMADHQRQLIRANEQMTRLANTDQLTGTYNRRFMYSILESEKCRSGDRRPYVIAIIDIDNFKQINDRFGHLAGDKVLQDIVQIILGLIRTGDVVARWGGEEFLVLLPNTDLVNGISVMERVRKTLADKVYESDGITFQTTLTIGLADSTGKQPIDEIISLADERLYRGKREGKNKVVTCS